MSCTSEKPSNWMLFPEPTQGSASPCTLGILAHTVVKCTPQRRSYAMGMGTASSIGSSTRYAPRAPFRRHQERRQRMKPAKNGLHREMGAVKVLIPGEDGHAASVACAICDMLQVHPAHGDMTVVALFRNPGPCAEINYEGSLRESQTAPRATRFPELASGCHSLRIGEATTYVSAEDVGRLQLILRAPCALKPVIHICGLV